MEALSAPAGGRALRSRRVTSLARAARRGVHVSAIESAERGSPQTHRRGADLARLAFPRDGRFRQPTSRVLHARRRRLRRGAPTAHAGAHAGGVRGGREQAGVRVRRRRAGGAEAEQEKEELEAARTTRRMRATARATTGYRRTAFTPPSSTGSCTACPARCARSYRASCTTRRTTRARGRSRLRVPVDEQHVHGVFAAAGVSENRARVQQHAHRRHGRRQPAVVQPQPRHLQRRVGRHKEPREGDRVRQRHERRR